MKKSNFFLSTLFAAAALSVAPAIPAIADGDGTTSSTPFTGSCDGLDLWTTSTFPAGSTIYIDGITSGYLGTSNSSYTCVANIQIGSNGMTLNNGYSNATYTFSGNITGSGNWTYNNSGVAQKYTFTGSLAGWTGNLDYSNTNADGYFHFGEEGGTAAVDVNVSGTGYIIHRGNITFNYDNYASVSSTELVIGNSYITAGTLEFTGGVNYLVTSELSGYSSSATLTISNQGTTTLTGNISNFSSIEINDGATLNMNMGTDATITSVTAINVNSGGTYQLGSSLSATELNIASGGKLEIIGDVELSSNLTAKKETTISVDSNATLTLSGRVSISTAIENSGTIVLNDSVTFALSGMSHTGELDDDAGATYTLIVGGSDGVGVVEGWENLTLDNISSSVITGLIGYNYDEETGTLTVVATGDENTYLSSTVTLVDETSGSRSDTGAGRIYTTKVKGAEEYSEFGWLEWQDSAITGNTNPLVLGESDEQAHLRGDSGLIGILFKLGDGNLLNIVVDLTNTEASEFYGSLMVLNEWNNNFEVHLLGDSWANVEYVYGYVANEKGWAHVTTAGDNSRGQQVLILQGDTSFAGITGSSKGFSVGSVTSTNSKEFLKASASGTTLTLTGDGTYAFYGSVGETSARLNIDKTGTGSQTLGGTNYLQNVTVTGGTLVLGDSDISGSITVSGWGSEFSADGTITADSISVSNNATLSGSGTYDIPIIDIGSGIEATIGNIGTSLTKQGDGTLTITNTVSASSISVSSGTLIIKEINSAARVTVWEDTTLEIDKVSVSSGTLNITVEGGILSAIDIGSNVRVTVDESGTLKDVTLSNGGTLVVEDDTVVSLSGTISLTGGTINLSDIVFVSSSGDGQSDAVVIFDVSELSSSEAESLVNTLNTEGVVTVTVSGAFSLDEETGNIVFVATSSSLSWNTDWTDKTWSENKFGSSDRSVGSQDSAVFGTLDGLEEIQIVGAVQASSVTVKASDAGTYVFYDGSLTLAGNLTVSSGTLELETALTAGNIQIRGGTLVVTDKGSATAEDEVSIRSGTLRVESAGALTASDIEMTGGELAFVAGALDNVDSIYLAAGSSSNPATLTWISGNTDNSVLGLLTVEISSYVCFNIESGVVDTNSLGVITISSGNVNYIKTGAGELQLSQTRMLQGTLTINEGTVAITISSSEVGGAFSGDIVISGSTAVLRIDSDDPFDSTNTITILDGGTLQFGDATGTGVEQVDIYGTITLGDGAKITDAQTYSSTTNAYYAALYMTNGSSVVVNASATATIEALVALGQDDTTFNVGRDATLTVSRITYLDNEEGEGYGITKTGAGKLILQSSNQSSYYNDYTGTTTISAGTFCVAGTLTLEGAISIANIATLEVDVGNGTATFAGTISGSGNILITSGTAVVTGGISGSSISTTVNEDTTLLFGSGVNYSGDLYLAGALGGSGNGTKTFSGSLTLTDTATFVGTTFTLSGTLTDESTTTIRVVGGDLIIANAGLGATDYEVTSRGILETNTTVSADSVTLTNGTITSTGISGSWEINNLVIDSGSNGLAGNVTLVDATGTGNVTLTLNGALQIGGDLTGLSKADGMLSTDGTLIIAGTSRNGSLTISYTYETDQNSGETLEYWGELSVGELVLSADYSGSTTITLDGGILTVKTGATFEQAVTITGSGTFNANGTISFQGLEESRIQGGNLVITQGEETIFDVEERATIASAIWNDSLTLNATETDEDGNVSETTVTTYILTKDTTIHKTGSGTLVLNGSAVPYLSDTRDWGDNIEVENEPAHYFTANIVVDGGTLWINSGSGALGGSGDFTVDNATLYVADGIDKTCGSITLTNGATLTAGSGGNGVVTVGGSGGESGSLTALDATINGTVQLSSAGDFVLGGLTINGSLELGSSGNGGNGIKNLTIDGSFGGITITGSLSIRSVDATQSPEININLTNVGAIGAEYVLIESTSRSGISLSTEELDLIKLSDDFKLAGDKRTFTVEVSNGNLVVKAYGTLVWDGATNWVDNSSGWQKTAVTGNTSSNFSTGDYVDFQFSGSDTTQNIIAVGEGGVSVGGAAFNGADSSSVFVVNFGSENGILASTTAEAQTAVSINSGTVIFEATQGVEGVNHTFNAGLYITSGATLQVETLVSEQYMLGMGAISLGGTLALTYTDDEGTENTITNDIAVTTASSAISVGTDAVVNLTGTVSGDGVLNKLGDGTLNLTANEDTSVYGISVAEGTMNISGEGDLAVSAIEVASGATLNLTGSTTLTSDTELYISGTATFEASGSKLGTLVMTDGAIMSVADISDPEEEGGYFSIDSNASFSVSGEATIDAGLELVFGDDASLSIYVASGGKLTVTGDVVDDDDDYYSEDGSFTITKSGAGELAFDSYWNDADLVFTAGTISFNDFAEVSGNINATGSGLVMNFALSSDYSSFIGTGASEYEEATIFSVSGTLSINVTKTDDDVSGDVSGDDRELVIMGNLSATNGVLNISTEEGTKVVIDGVTNAYNTIYVLENSKLEIGDDVESFSGTLLQLAGDATLEVSATLTESSGGLRVGDYTTISFTGEGTSIAFSTFQGLNTTSTYDLTVTGNGTLIIGDGYAGTNNINNLVITVEGGATFQNAGTMLAGTFAGKGIVGNTGTMTITKASDSFTGTLLISSGAVQISETTSTSGSRVTATGSLANATAQIKEEGSLVIGISSDAAIGTVDGATTVVGSASGTGSIIILNTELFFGEDSLYDFTGTLSAIAGTINYGTVATESSATAIVIGGEYEGGSYSGRLNVNEEGLSEVSIGKGKTVSVSNGFITVADGITLTVEADEFTASGAVYFDGEGDTIVSSSITNAVEDGSFEIVVTDGTVTLSGKENEQTLTSIYSPGKVIFGSTGSLGADDASVVLYGGTVRFEGEFDGMIDTTISGTGTIEGASTATISGIASNFTGYILATNNATITIEKTSDSLSTATVFFGADEGATLVISTANAEDETTFGDGSAYFYGDGTIEFDVGEGNTLQITNASLYDEESGLELTATINVASGTLQIGSSAYIGTGNINVSGGAILLFTDRSTLGNNVTGNGTVTKRGAGTTSYINALSASALIESGTLSITSTSSTPTITMAAGSGAILELSQVWDDEKLAYVDRDTAQTFEAKYVVDGETGSVTFSHSASTGYSIVNGSLTAGEGNTIVLSGGGEGSYFNVAVDSAAVQKIGTGTWILTNYSSSAGITVDAGTLVIQGYGADEDQTINIKSNATLEIDSFTSDAVVQGTITGSGTLLIADTTDTVTLDLSKGSTNDWTLMVGAGTAVKVVSDISNNVTLNSGSTLIVDVKKDEETMLSGFISTVDGSTLEKTGDGNLVINNSSTIIYGSLDVEEGSVTITTDSFIAINQSSSKITVAKDADLIFALSEDATAYLRTQISGAGTIEVQSGTVEFYTLSGDFAGTIQIDGENTDDPTETTGPGTVVFTVSMTNFGGSINIDDGGTLRIQSGSTTLSKNITGDGTIVIAHSSTSSTTTYVGSDFAGTFEIESGGLKVSATDWTDLKNEVILTGGSSASLIIDNSEGNTVELKDNDNVSSTTSGAKIALEGGKFYIGSGDTFGTSKTVLSVSSGATLGVDYGATISSGLYVANGAIFELGIDSASNVGTLSTLANTPVFTAASSSSTSVSVSGTVEIYGTMKVVVPEDASSSTTMISSTGAATIGSTATIIFTDANSYLESGSITLVSASRATIASGSAFVTDDGIELRAIVSGNSIQVGQQVEYSTPSGLSEFVKLLDTDPNSDIYGAIWHESGDQRARLLNFSPVSFGALSEMAIGLAHIETDLLRQRLEQRRYDIPYDTDDAIKGFANAIGGATDTDKGKDKKRNYNISHFGVIAGMDAKISSELLLGASISYDSSTAKMHNSGGKHTANLTRIGVYGMYMIDDVTYIDLGASLGFAGYDTKRKNALETVKGDVSGTDFTLSATIGRMFVISSRHGLHFAPYIGLDYTYDYIDNFSENEGATAFDVDSMDRNSLRGLIGATLNWVPTEDIRIGLELTYAHEFLDTDQDIDAEFSNHSSYSGQGFTTTAYFADEDTISVGPRIDYRLDDNWSLSAGYTFQTDFDGTMAHSGNVGVRYKF